MFDHFTLRHLPPLLLGTILTIGGTMSFTSGPEEALTKFGFREHVASNKAAWPVIKLEGSRITTIGLTIWGLYIGNHFEAMDILFAAMGWMAVIDGVVCAEHARPGSATFRASSTGVVALWGALGMTSGKYF